MTSIESLRSARSTGLLAGVLLAPFFYVVVLGQVLLREGFDISRHAISSLSLGDAGWIQVANFVVTGIFALAAAWALRSALADGKASRFGPLLVALYGVGITVAGVVKTDPALGFPPGTPDAMPVVMSGSAVGHSLGFLLAFGSLTAACFVVARRFAEIGDWAWCRYSIGNGVMTPLLIAVGMAQPSAAGVLFALAGLVAFGWLSALCGHLRQHPVSTPESRPN